MKKLLDWFTAQDYSDGVAVLREMDPRNTKLTFFSSVKDCRAGLLHHNLLKSELERLKRIHGQEVKLPQSAKGNPVIAVQEETPVAVPVAETASVDSLKTRIIKDTPFFKYEELSPEMQQLYTEIGEEYKKMAAFHMKAKVVENPVDRQHAITQAAAIEDAISGKYTELDAWLKGQREGAEEDTDEATAENENVTEEDKEKAEKLQRLKNVRSNISKNNKKLEGLEEGSEKYQEILKRNEALIEERDNLEQWKTENC